MKKLRVYVAGPLTDGDVAHNIHRVLEIAMKIRDLGHIPFIPHLNHFWNVAFPRNYEYWMEWDFDWLEVCDVVFRLPGKSSGADRETTMAMHKGMPIFLKIEELIDFANKIK